MGRDSRFAMIGPCRVDDTWCLPSHGSVVRYSSRDLEKRVIVKVGIQAFGEGKGAPKVKHGPMYAMTKSERPCESFRNLDMFSDAWKSHHPVYSVFFLFLDFVPSYHIFKLLLLN